MKRFSILILTTTLLLAACASASPGQAVSTGTAGALSASQCGNGVCEADESAASCLSDCPATAFSGRVETTYIESEGIKIAVRVASPQVHRYTDGAGVVLVVSPTFSEAGGFPTDPNLTSLGLVQVSYLWPGATDAATGVSSEGEFDYGDEQSTQVLRDVIRFAAGRMADASGRYIVAMTSVPPLTDELGLYAFGDAGIVAINTLSLYGDQFQGLEYFVGNENPTVDTLACLEAGYYDAAGQPVYNPLYAYPSSYGSAALTMSFTNLRWDPAYTDASSSALGRPYLDLDGSGDISAGDYIFSGQVPVMFGKRYYSVALTQALFDSGAISSSAWPSDLATPQAASAAWPSRQSPGRFAAIQDRDIISTLRVMLVFAQDDHAQVAQDKPHVHQEYQGFRFESRLWVRLNPDRAYVQSLLPTAGQDFPDNPANTQPDDWANIGEYAYPDQGQARRLVPLAAVSEMADRAHTGRWDEDFGRVLYELPVSTPQP